MAENDRAMRLKDRPEFASKPKPLTFAATATVREAANEMSRLNYGSVFVVDGEERVEGVVTERDLLRRVISEGRDPETTPLADIMTADPRVAKEDDDLLEWLRIMSNERFRRLPVVDNDGRIKVVFTQGDFVSYTWPDLMYQVRQYAKAQLASNFPLVLIAGGIALYTILMAVIFSVM